MIRKRPATRWPTFPPETLRRLFDAVDVDDVIDAHVCLPERIVLDCTQDSLRRCYGLCLQFWEDGFTREELLQLVHKLLRNQGLTADERLQFKHIRARYKHLRFAQRLYGKRHIANALFDLTTRALGNLQDAFRTGQREAVVRYGRKLCLLLSRPVWTLVRLAMEHTRLDSVAGFIAYRQAQMRQLKEVLAKEAFTGREFHTVRKIISQEVSYYDTVRTLEPNEDAYRMSRFLAAINGLMGARHDEMVADSFSGRVDYDQPAPLNREIRWRLEKLIARYPLADEAPAAAPERCPKPR